jgi:hypothetical protein
MVEGSGWKPSSHRASLKTGMRGLMIQHITGSKFKKAIDDVLRMMYEIGRSGKSRNFKSAMCELKKKVREKIRRKAVESGLLPKRKLKE